MELSPKTKVAELLKRYPFLIDFLAELDPKFAGLKNPVLRNTLGRVASLAKVATMGEMPLDELVAAITKKVEQETGELLTYDAGDIPITDEERQEVLRGIINDLHAGKDMAELKQRFADLIEDIDPAEIAAMEQKLIEGGMPQEEVKRLCDVHVEVFKESLDRQDPAEMPPGHPVRTFMDENKALGEAAEQFNKLLTGLCDPPMAGRLELVREELAGLLNKLEQVDFHYLRKENQLFPFLEKNSVTGPPQVMWGIHDDVRAELKEARAALGGSELEELTIKGQHVATAIGDMIYKEDNILFPMSLSILSEAEWAEIRAGEGEIGYALVTPGDEWVPGTGGHGGDEALRKAAITDSLPMDTGLLSLEQINLLMTHLPIEISFTDENDEVRYYSATPERVFPRSPGVIGRKVENCHPPKSVHMVKEILESFRAGKQDKAEFWIQLQGRVVHICYFAVRDADGNFRGTMETIQDVTEIQKITGERRLLEWES